LEDWALIRRLAAEGVPKARIAERLEISRTTVVKAVSSDAPPRYERKPGPRSFTEFEPRVRALLKDVPDMLAERVGWSGSIRWFSENVKTPRVEQRPVDPADRISWAAGDAALFPTNLEGQRISRTGLLHYAFAVGAFTLTYLAISGMTPALRDLDPSGWTRAPLRSAGLGGVDRGTRARLRRRHDVPTPAQGLRTVRTCLPAYHQRLVRPRRRFDHQPIELTHPASRAIQTCHMWSTTTTRSEPPGRNCAGLTPGSPFGCSDEPSPKQAARLLSHDPRDCRRRGDLGPPR
jgi:hypothetical protein